MAVRIVLFLVGLGFAGGGSYLGWLNRDLAASIFPPDPGGSPWLLIAGVALLCIGVVLVGSGVAPRPERAARLAAEAARREDMISRADTYYAARARAADRDWRSGDIPPPARTDPIPAEATDAPFAPAQAVSPAPLPTEPRAPLAATAFNAAPQAMTSFAAIHAAMKEDRLDEADRLLNSERERLISLGEAGQAELAELTSVAGDHAAASGRPGHAKWLWRLALKRFGDIGQVSSPAAQAVSERLRRIDQ